MSVGAFAVLALAVGAPAAGRAAEPPAGRRPNVVIILADDLGYADVGCQGCKDVPTPHIDSIAHNGVRCTNGYVSHPYCSPTRASLMTGRYQHRFGHECNPTFDRNDTRLGLPVGEVTIAQVLRDAGYATGAVGKWHLGAAERFHPCRRGFAEFFGFLGGGHNYFNAQPHGREYLTPLMRNEQEVAHADYLTTAFAREAVAFIDRHRAEPFFLYLAFNAVHTPLQAPPKYLERFAGIADPKRRTYAAMLAALDDGVGVVLNALHTRGLGEHTLVFFLSDNGGPPQANGSRNDPLRGAKGQVYEGGIRVPFLVQWTGKLPAGKLYDEPVTCRDILPTAAELAGAKLPADRPIDGVDILPFLRGDRTGAPHDTLVWRRWEQRAYAVRQGRYKLVHTVGRPAELYDLAADIAESNDLAAAHMDRVAALEQAYQSWEKPMVAPLWLNPRQAATPPNP
jgi:arylsulfatase A-like enzyme